VCRTDTPTGFHTCFISAPKAPQLAKSQVDAVEFSGQAGNRSPV
jgi:hypothetical protein